MNNKAIVNILQCIRFERNKYRNWNIAFLSQMNSDEQEKHEEKRLNL